MVGAYAQPAGIVCEIIDTTGILLRIFEIPYLRSLKFPTL